VASIHNAFMNSEHHRDNILYAKFNQVGIGVIVSGETIFVTEDFLGANGGPASARPTPVAHPAAKKPASAPKPSNRVASAAAPRPAVPVASPPTTAAPPPPPSPTGVVTALPLEPAPVKAVASPGRVVTHGPASMWAA